MRGMEFLDKLESIDPAYLAEAEQAPIQKRRRLPRWGVALAACLALLVSAGAALAISGYGVRLLHTFTARPEGDFVPGSGYVIEVQPKLFPLSAFTGEVLEAKADILAEYEKWFAYHSNFYATRGEDFAALLEDRPEEYSFTGSCKRDFATAQEALDYIGLAALKYPDLGLEEQAVWSAALGNSLGQIESVSFCVCYDIETLHIQVSALMFTEYEPTGSSKYFPEELSEGASEGSIIMFTYTYEDISYTEDLYTTAAGRQCQILDSTPFEDGHCDMSAHLVADGIEYGINISHLPEDADQALELLHLWADQL